MPTFTLLESQLQSGGNEIVLATDHVPAEEATKGPSFEGRGGSMRVGRSSFELITYCTVAALAAALAFAVVFASATLAFGIAQTNSVDDPQPKSGPGAFLVDAPNEVAQDSGSQTFSGVITDEHCGARHQPESDKGPAECVKMCVDKGSHYALVNGDKVFLLENGTGELGKLAGQRVNVVGSQEGDTIRVVAVSPITE